MRVGHSLISSQAKEKAEIQQSFIYHLRFHPLQTATCHQSPPSTFASISPERIQRQPVMEILITMLRNKNNNKGAKFNHFFNLVFKEKKKKRDCHPSIQMEMNQRTYETAGADNVIYCGFI